MFSTDHGSGGSWRCITSSQGACSISPCATRIALSPCCLLQITTVDKCQGQQNDYVLMSLPLQH